MCWEWSDKMSASGTLSYFSFLKHSSLVFLLQTRAGPCTDFYKSKNASVPPSVTTAHLGLLYLQPEFRLYRRVQGIGYLMNLTLQKEYAAAEEEE